MSISSHCSSYGKMANKDFLKKFPNPSDLDILVSTLDGDVQLDEEYPTLYNKLYAYYQSKGVQFVDDIDDDYEVILNQLEKDLL